MDNRTFKSIKKIVLKGKFKGSVYAEYMKKFYWSERKKQ